ncbi:MAG TPA: CDP-alcohol phosphatidyltransferase family protein [Thermodesulfobacteriota bacterium]|nr:CDP-alcohol phosphatidyltransferase family protein [Thermodesulfobacteriota bacterium]
MLKALIGDNLDPFLQGTSSFVQRLGLKPNTLTFIGLGLNVLAGLALGAGEWLQGASLIVLAGFFDILDGAVARNCRQASPFGSFLDSVLDRYSDLTLLIGLLIFYSRQGEVLYQVLAGLSLMGTALVPYTRSRAEVLIPKCNVGLLERPERVLLIFLGTAIVSIMPIIIWILAVLTNVTVIQRILYTWRQVKDAGKE